MVEKDHEDLLNYLFVTSISGARPLGWNTISRWCDMTEMAVSRCCHPGHRGPCHPGALQQNSYINSAVTTEHRNCARAGEEL